MVLAACLLADPGEAAAALSAAEIRAAAEEVLDDDGIQAELPGKLVRPESPPREPWFTFRLRPPEGTGEVTGLLLRVMLVAGAVVLAFLLFGALRDSKLFAARRPAGEAREAAGVVLPPLAEAGDALAQADALAAEGRFTEAVHLLLLGCLEGLRRSHDRAPPRSWTSREILRGLSLPAAAEAALTRIVGAVELAYFGGRDCGEEIYLACRGHFQAFAAATQGGSSEDRA